MLPCDWVTQRCQSRVWPTGSDVSGKVHFLSLRLAKNETCPYRHILVFSPASTWPVTWCQLSLLIMIVLVISSLWLSLGVSGVCSESDEHGWSLSINKLASVLLLVLLLRLHKQISISITISTITKAKFALLFSVTIERSAAKLI